MGIVNGDYAHHNEWPMMVAIMLDDEDGFRSYCGATLWTPNWILTAAHCAFSSENDPYKLEVIKVVIGETDLSGSIDSEHIFHLSELVIHPEYDHGEGPQGGADIALFKLNRSVVFEGTVNSGVLCTCAKAPRAEAPFAAHCYVVGWGMDGENSETLRFHWYREVKVPIIDIEVCRRALPTGAAQEGLICAGYDHGTKDSCRGDSGGPLFCSLTNSAPYEYVQVGVVSFGQGCARPKHPGYYTRVKYYLPWIKKVTGCG
ncbi:peptidase S1 [Tyrophagus putrescentiae]|nr:peptidase S1 [Tyrophagus putrescentiae]